MDMKRREGTSFFTCGASRREFLKIFAALGAGAFVPGGRLLAQTAPPAARAKLGRIDVHHHFFPPEYVSRSGSAIARLGAGNWVTAASIEQMDKFGISTALLSMTTPGIWFGKADEARSLARICNDYGAQMVKDNPGRFGLFAAIPLPDPEGSLKEIAYAFDVLHADGIGLMTNYGDKWPGDPAYVSVYEELNRRKAVVFIHPTTPNCCGNLIPGVTPYWTEFDFDTTRAVESLLVNGFLSRFPEIRFIITHSGATLPVLAGRINDRFPKDRANLVPNGVLYELKKLYFEVAHATYPAPLAALMKFAPPSQILFGTDYPLEPMESTTKPLAEYGLPAAMLQVIDRGNAERLFPRLKG